MVIESIWLRLLGAWYSEDELCAVIAGEQPYTPYQKRTVAVSQKGGLRIDIEAKMRAGKYLLITLGGSAPESSEFIA